MNALWQLDGVAWWQVAGWTMLHYLWMGAVVGMAALASRVALRRASANARYAAALGWLVVLAVLPVGIGIGVGRGIDVGGIADTASVGNRAVELSSTPAIETPLAPGSTGGLNLTPVSPDLAVESPNRFPTESPNVPNPPYPRQSRGLAGGYEWQSVIELGATYLPWVWIVGAPLTFLLLTTGVVGAERLRRESRVVRDGAIFEALQRLAESLQIGRRVTIAVCERIAAPVLVGIVRPMILLPPAVLTGWSPDEIEMVLLHELAHVRRWDNLVNLVQRMVEAVLFFQPAVWLVSGWVRREREACCDAVVVGRTQRPQAYAELLVALASQLPRSVLFHPAATSAMAAGPLRGRIRRILGMEDDPMLISGKSLGVVMGSLLLAATLVVLNLTTNTQAEEESLTTEGTEGTTATDTLEAERINITSKDGQANLHAQNGRLVLSTSVKARWPDESLFKDEAESQLSKRAFQVLRLKLIGATEDDLKRFGAKRGLFIVELDRANRPMLLKQVNGAPIESFSDLEAALDGMKEAPGTVVINCMVATDIGPQQVAYRRVNSLDGFGLQPLDEATAAQWPTEESDDTTTGNSEGIESEIDIAKQRARTQNNLRNLALALLNYEAVHKHFPARAKFDAGGKPLLSWRVMILPYLDPAYAKLYDEFHLDEPWDSPHNKQLVARMPEVFHNPRIAQPGMTNYLAVVGEECVFDPKGEPIALRQVSDGTANTIAIVEADADRAVEWTRPDDWEFDRARPTAGLGKLWPDGWTAVWVDGHIRRVSNDEPAEQVGINFTRNGREVSSLSESQAGGGMDMGMEGGTDAGMEMGGRGMEMGGEMMGGRGNSYGMARGMPVESDAGMMGHGEMGMGRGGVFVGETAAEREIRLKEIAELQKSKVALEKQILELHANFRDLVRQLDASTDRDANSKSATVRKEYKIRVGMLRQQLANVNESLGKLEAVPATAAPAKKFPTLEEQKLADLIWKRMRLEIEPLSGPTAKRVEALGYRGGVEIKYVGRGPGRGEYGEMESGDILVGLHVWPTPDLQSVANVLDREDLDEFNPLKFYVVRQMEVYTGLSVESRKDELVTGRISVELPAEKQTTTSTLSGTPVLPLDAGNSGAKTPLAPGMKEVREERVDPDTGRTQTIITVIPESQPSSPAPRPTLLPPPDRPGSVPIEESSPAIPNDVVEALRERGPLTVVLVYGANSQPCREMRKMLQEFERTHLSLPVTFASQDVEMNRSDAIRNGIERVPTLVWLRDDEVLKKSVGALSLAEFSKQLCAVARTLPEKKAVPPKLLYDGKTFEQWRSAWKTELSMENRLEAVKALAAFGANGQGKEATEAILEVAEQLDWSYIDGTSAAGKLKRACVDSFSTGQTTGGYHIPAVDWFPLVAAVLVKSGEKFSIGSYLHGQPPRGETSLIPELLELCQNPVTKPWALGGLKSVDPGFADERVLPIFVSQLEEVKNKPEELPWAIRSFVYTMEGKYDSKGQPLRKLRYVPELEALLFDENRDVRRSARWAFSYLPPNDATAVVARLVDVVEEPERKADRIEAIRALAAIGAPAKSAEGKLLSIARSDKDPARFAAAAALASIWNGSLDVRNNPRSDEFYGRLFGTDSDERRKKFGEFDGPLYEEKDEILNPQDTRMLGGGGGMF